MAKDLDLGRNADNGPRLDCAFHEAFRRVTKRTAIRLSLEPASVLVVGNRVEVELLTVWVAHDKAYGSMIFDDDESLRSQAALDRGEICQSDHEIEVVVRSGLLAQERIDAPPAINSAVNSRGAKCRE